MPDSRNLAFILYIDQDGNRENKEEKYGEKREIHKIQSGHEHASDHICLCISADHISLYYPCSPAGRKRKDRLCKLRDQLFFHVCHAGHTYLWNTCLCQVRDDKEQMSKTAQEIWMINGIMTLLAYAALAVALICVPRFKAERILLLVCSLSLFLNLIAMEWVYKALECYTYITMRSLAFKVLAVICMFLMVHTKEDYVKYAGITVLANTGYGVFNLFNLRKHIIFKRFKDYHFRRHLKPVFIFFAMSVAITIYSNLDITMLGFMRDNTEVGYYDVAIKIKVILVNIVTSLGAVLLPRTSYYVEMKMEREFRTVSGKALEFVAVLSIPLTVSFTIMAKQCILLLSGNAYLPSVIPMCIIMPTLILIAPVMFLVSRCWSHWEKKRSFCIRNVQELWLILS